MEYDKLSKMTISTVFVYSKKCMNGNTIVFINNFWKEINVMVMECCSFGKVMVSRMRWFWIWYSFEYIFILKEEREMLS